MRDVDFFLRQFAPVTTHMAFVEMPAHKFADAFVAWRQEINALFEFDWKERIHATGGNLAGKLYKLLPLAVGPQTKHLITETRSKWSAYIPNGARGGDVHSPIRHLTRVLAVRSVTVVMTTDQPAGQPGSVQFILQDASHGALQVRSVAAHRESKWEFHEHGEPLDFEKKERYKARKVKDRLTPEVIELYCHHLGIRLFDPDFYDGAGFIIESFPAPTTGFKPRYPNQSAD